MKETPSILRIIQSDFGAYISLAIPVISWLTYLWILFREGDSSGNLGTVFVYFLVFTLVGMLVAIWRIYFISTIFDYGVEVPGQVERIGFYRGRGRVVFYYLYQGNKLKASRAIVKNKFTSGIRPGENVAVVVNENNPKNAVIKRIFI